MRVLVLRATLSLALAVASASADPAERGLRAAGDTTNLDFGDLHGDVAAGLSFATLSGGSSSDAPGAVREVTVANGSRGPQDAAAGALAYTHPNGTSFYDVLGDLSSKWGSFGDAVPVPSGAQTNLATNCDATKDLDACVRACATACFGNNACQWFTLAPATRDCFLFRSIKPVAGVTFTAVAPEAQRICGYVKAAPPALLSAKATCTETRVYNGKDTFCVTADSAFYLESSTGKTQCAASPLTLMRSFQNNYFNKGTETALTEQLTTGQLLNAKQMAPPAAGGEFTVENFLQYIGPAKAPLVVTTNDVTEDPLTQQLTAAGTTTKWTYTFDANGRVASVTAPLSKKNLLFAKDTTTGKMTQRKDYGKPALQTRFSYSVHALSAVKVAQPNLGAANGGEIADSLFTSPNGFWNLVPQSDASRVTGCWKQSNDLIAKLLEWGFTVDFTAQPQYFTSADAVQAEALKAVASSHQLLSGADVKQFYESTGTGVGDLNFQADFPCAYLYRPYAMKASVKLTACKEGSYCSGAWPAIQKATDKTFFTVSSIGAIETSRSFAHWAFENKDGGVKGGKPNFTYLKALATSTAGVCFTETGKSLQTLSLSSKVSDVLLVTKDGKCVALSATDGSPTIVDCDASATRVSFDGSATTASCLVGSGAACPTFAFTTALSETIAIKQRDDLVTGTLSFGDKGCLVVDVSKITFSTDKAACSPIKASHVTLVANGGDPVDPDEATEAPVVSQNTVVAPPAKREIDDPDMEAN